MNGMTLPGGPVKSRSKVVALAILLTLTRLVNSGYARQVVVVAPAPVVQVVVSVPFITLFGGDYDGRREAREYGRRGHESRGAAHGPGGRGGRR